MESCLNIYWNLEELSVRFAALAHWNSAMTSQNAIAETDYVLGRC
jgi:hypothetical protein